MRYSTNPQVWRTADRREIPIVELERGHLKNIIAMLRRKVRDIVRQAQSSLESATPHGDAACDAVDHELRVLDVLEHGHVVGTITIDEVLERIVPQWETLISRARDLNLEPIDLTRTADGSFAMSKRLS